MPGFIGFPELLLLGLVALLVFGPKRLPEMGRSLGRGLREFKDSVTGDSERESDVTVEDAPARPAQLSAAPAVTSEPAPLATADRKVAQS